MSERTRHAAGPLDRERVVEAALEFVATDGIAGLSMRRLADRIGVAPMSLYRHVDCKAELLALVVDAIAARVPAPDADGPWDVTVTEMFTGLRRLLLDHPGIAAFVTDRTLFTPSVLRAVDAVLVALGRAGLGPRGAARAFTTLWTFTLGSVLAEESYAAGGGASRREAERQRIVDELAAAAGVAAPAVAAAVPHWRVADPEETYRLGLGLLLEGLRRSPPE